MDLLERWRRTWTHGSRPPPEALATEVLAAYAEPHRAYHTQQHLSECFVHLDGSPLQPREPLLFELALWFHDGIYDTRASDNEAKSADWARSALPSLTPSELDRIERLIMVTCHDAEPHDEDEGLLLDIDLSILGAPPQRFDEYERQVREEFEWVPEQAYRDARAKILRQFEARPELYHTDYFRGRLDQAARQNLRASIERLGADPP